MKSKTTVTVSEPLLEQLSYVRDCLVASARRNPGRSNPALLRKQVGLGAAVEELCRRFFMDMERQQAYSRRKEKERTAASMGLYPAELAMLNAENSPNPFE